MKNEFIIILKTEAREPNKQNNAFYLSLPKLQLQWNKRSKLLEKLLHSVGVGIKE